MGGREGKGVRKKGGREGEIVEEKRAREALVRIWIQGYGLPS